MSEKKLYCTRCQKAITERKDLVVANIKFKLRPFHKKCFDEHIGQKQEEARMFFDAMPVNGTYGNVMAILFILLIIFFAGFYEVNIFIYFICMLFPLFRIMSWLFLERRLN